MCAGGKKFVSEIKLECGNRIKKKKKTDYVIYFCRCSLSLGKLKTKQNVTVCV